MPDMLTVNALELQANSKSVVALPVMPLIDVQAVALFVQVGHLQQCKVTKHRLHANKQC